MNYLFTVALFAISLYVLYSAVTAKGKLFATDNILEEKIPQFVKLLRGIYLGLGIVMLLMAALSGAKQGLYSDANLVGKLTEQFQTDYASNIKANGEIRDTEYNVNDYIRFETAQMLISTLPQPVLASGETFNSNLYFMPSTDADGNNLFMLKTESAPNQNETYAKLRSVFPERLLSILSYVFMGIALAVILGLFVLINKFTDKEKAAKAKAEQAGTAMPASAFQFDEESGSDA